MKTLLLSASIFAMAHATGAQTLTLAGETYPPYSYRDSNGNPGGVYIDQIRLIMERANIDFKASILPWARAIALAESTPMHCAYATARTIERERHFRWVGPLHTDRNLLIVNDRSGISINSLEDAHDYVVGTQRNDYTFEILKEKGFHRIDLSADFSSTLNKLVNGRIDIMPMSESTFRKLYTSNTKFREIGVLSKEHLGMACNTSVPEKTINALQKQLDALIADGTQRKIYIRHGVMVPEATD